MTKDSSVIKIHTSDRISFKRCRRKWDYTSPLRRNLRPKEGATASLWFGSGFHFALEDFHGYNRFGDPVKAFEAYFQAHKQHELPAEAPELMELAEGMLNYYKMWLTHRQEYQTLMIGNKPQVEVNWSIMLQEESEKLGTPVYYDGTFDRLVLDAWGRLWVMEYKTAARFDTGKLETDPQVNAYTWAAQLLYPQYVVEGVIYMQFLKSVPNPPQMLQNGDFSINKNQNTTFALYRQAVIEKFGKTAPSKYVEMLNHLAAQETPEGDKFICRHIIRRNDAFKQAERNKIYMEVMDMLGGPSIYPNPTRDCSWDCNFRTACLATDDGSDPEFILEAEFQKREEQIHFWRKRVPELGEGDLAEGSEWLGSDSDTNGSESGNN